VSQNWLPIRCDLHVDPAVIAIADATGTDEFSVVGRLVRLWSWANEQLPDGNAPSVTVSWIDRYLLCPGFASAMVKAGWLTEEAGGVAFPKFEVWNSQGAKIRKVTAKRVGRHRAKGNAKGNGDSVTPVTQKPLPRERERDREREEEGKTPPNPPQAGARADRPPAKKFDPLAVDLPHKSPAFAGAWAEWVKHRGEKRERLTPTTTTRQLKALGELPEQNAVDCIGRSIANGWTGLFPDNHRGIKPQPSARPQAGESNVDKAKRLRAEMEAARAAQEDNP